MTSGESRKLNPMCLVIALAILASVRPALGAEPAGLPLSEIRAIAAREFPSLERLYMEVHRNPELSLMEEKTAERIARELREAGFDVTEGVGGFGVVGVLRNGAGKTLMIRADMDALPIREETAAPYASEAQVKLRDGTLANVMHACGHDVHVANLVGVARAMGQLKPRWKGTLVLIAQPAEEVGRGARAMLADGLFTRFPRPDWALALHVDASLELGKIGYTPGYAMANVDSVDVVIRGVGGHGAQPQQTKDPIVMAAQAVLALQTIASREVHPLEPVVVTVGSIHGGTKHNIIPGEVKLQLTVRTYKDEVREQVLEAIERIVKGVAETAGVPKELEPTVTVTAEGTPAAYNTPELVERIVGVMRTVVGEENIVRRDPTMGGEDFGRYGRVDPPIPIFMYRLGSIAPAKIAESKKPGGDPLPGLHSSKYLPERSAIRIGVETMTAAAIDLLQ